MTIWEGFTNSWGKKRSERQGRKGKILTKCRVLKNSKEKWKDLFLNEQCKERKTIEWERPTLFKNRENANTVVQVVVDSQEGWRESAEIPVSLSFSQLKKITFQITLLISNIKKQELLVRNNRSYLTHSYFPMVLSFPKNANLSLHITRLENLRIC